MKKPILLLKTLLIIAILQFFCVNSLIAQALPTTIMFQNSSQLYKNLRKGNGTYLDALALNGAGAKPGGIAAAGVGLMYLCISDAMLAKSNDSGNWQATSTQVIQTLNTFITFRTNGKTNGAGMYPRYFNFQNGNPDGTWSYEYSTMDNAIFAMGLIMCKNYFGNVDIDNKVTDLLSNMDFTKAIQPTRMALILNAAGNPTTIATDFTSPFNEYMLVAWLAKNAKTTNPGYAKSQTFWNTYFANPLTSPVSRPNYFGVTTLSDGAGWQSSFVPQFCYYFVSYFKGNANYMNYFGDWLTIDKTFCTNSGATNVNDWGLGAGEIPGGGYSADKVEGNPDNIVSPHIIAGFIPINVANSKNTLTNLYNANRGTYTIPGTTKKVLWRYKRGNPAQDANYIQAIDYSTMLFGLASLTEHLGANWFSLYNNPAGRGLKREIGNNSSEISTKGLINVNSYPNPSSSHFNLDIESLSDDQLDLKVYDMIGRQIEVRKGKVSELTSQVIGSNYPIGVYNVVVSQGDNVKSIRIVKK